MAKKMKKSDLFTQKLTNFQSAGLLIADSKVTSFTEAYEASDPIGFVIQRVDYELTPNRYTILQTADSQFDFGLCTIGTVPEGGFLLTSFGALDCKSLNLDVDGAPAQKSVEETHFFTDFSGLHGGGMLTHPAQLNSYIYNMTAIDSIAYLRTAITYFTVELNEALYKELWQNVWARTV